jgi:hypothetical protein
MKLLSSKKSTLQIATILLGLVASCLTTGCVGGMSKRFRITNAPIQAQSISKSADEEALNFFVTFKNMGQDVISFDYTIADAPNIPHVDSAGPNSGLIENLYPGALVELKNPFKTNNVYLALGKITVGKMTPDAVKSHYNVASATASVIPATELPPF